MSIVIKDNITELQSTLGEWRTKGQSIAFVPTMGGLHDGHLSLIKLAKQKADKVVVSVFVNPAQFSENEDFGTYPRTLESDLSVLTAQGVDCVFIPSINEMYPNGVDETFDIGWIGQILCGKTRPHFFNGVVQVVRRLFEIIKPDSAVFGQKDYQQFKIMQKFTIGVEIIAGDTVREKNGLAMSTRNQYLSADERRVASKFYQILQMIQQGSLDKNQALNTLEKYFKVDYLEILDGDTLKKITDNSCKIAILSAVFLGSIRLIDNIVYNEKARPSHEI